MARSSWDGYLRLSLISIPVRAFNAVVPGHGAIHFNQLHEGCGERIQYKKFCPVHGEVTKDEIVSGYPVKKDQYVEVKPEELTALRAEDDESIAIDAFTTMDALDPVHFSGKSFFLVPQGPAGQKPFALLRQVMADKQVDAFAHMVLSGHEEQVLIRPIDKVMEMMVLLYPSQIKTAASFDDEVKKSKISAEEEKLAAALVDESTVDSFDLSELKDRYTDRVTELLESKAAGKKIRQPRREKAPAVINLMEALKKSLRASQAPERPTRRRKKSA